jgi:hypothetical protein
MGALAETWAKLGYASGRCCNTDHGRAHLTVTSIAAMR